MPPLDRGIRWCEVKRKDALLQRAQAGWSCMMPGEVVSDEERRAKALALLRDF